MNKSNIKIIFVDVDWTLYDHKAKRFRKSGLKALNEAHSNGVKIVLCTGRPYCSLKGIGVLDKLDNDGFVCTNGGLAYTDGKYVLKQVIPNPIVNDIIDIAKKQNLVLEIMTPDDAFLISESDITIRFFEHWVEKKPRIEEYKGQEVTSMLLFSHQDSDKSFNKFPVYFYRFFDEGCDIYPSKYHKGLGVKAVLDYYGFSKEDAMGIGDDIPDIDMFNEVKYSIAMGNGREEAKEKAFYVTTPIDRKGIKKALKHFKVI